MSSFHYGDNLNGVKCDACGFKLYADVSGFFFGEHMRIAKADGWLIAKENGKWLNLCPTCKARKEELARERFFGSGDREEKKRATVS